MINPSVVLCIPFGAIICYALTLHRANQKRPPSFNGEDETSYQKKEAIGNVVPLSVVDAVIMPSRGVEGNETDRRASAKAQAQPAGRRESAIGHAETGLHTNAPGPNWQAPSILPAQSQTRNPPAAPTRRGSHLPSLVGLLFKSGQLQKL